MLWTELCFLSVFFPATEPSPHLLSSQTELPTTPQTCFKSLPCSCHSSHLYTYLPSSPLKPYLPFRVVSPCSILQESRSHPLDPSNKRGSTLPWWSCSCWCIQDACILLMSISVSFPLLRGNSFLESKEYVSRVWHSKALNTVPCASKVLVNHWPMRIFNFLIWNHWFSPS